MAGELDDKQYIFTLLTALIKKSPNQEIRISEEELVQVTKRDAVALMWDPNTSEVVLKVNPMMVPENLVYEN
jgi:hypothetical protein